MPRKGSDAFDQRIAYLLTQKRSCGALTIVEIAMIISIGSKRNRFGLIEPVVGRE